ncbi:ABC transporter permease [Synoicihabitans lomoniglobus]|uniref:ABC transporter permease n=1 Tax=Synoicihabitans lomoniglobus TaxID=2909285 RepID=A0AAF0CP71_9BACT|nr:ABC transporter permease [Opitutaceae bacterium LMO-M01]WED63484.1 ABC transporter permease [Opitutaceae bacterium LMO-M01]
MITERFRWWRTKFRRLFRRGQQEIAMDTEMQFHLDQLIAEFRAEGLSDREARLAARREFGTVDAYREEVRDSWRPPAFAEAWRSVTLAARSLVRTPGFTVLAVITLGLGIGANTAMFSVVNGIAFKPLPYRDADTLDYVFRRTAEAAKGSFSAPDFEDFRSAASGIYSDIAGTAFGDVSLAEPGAPAEIADRMLVTSNFFDMLGLPPTHGRDFRPEEDTAGAAAVAMISHSLWQNRFGARDDIVGQTIRLNGDPHTVIGIVPEAFNDWRHLGWVDVFCPLALTADQRADRGTPAVEIMARRAPGVTAAAAGAFVSAYGEQLAQDHPDLHAESSAYTMAVPEIVTDSGSKVTLGMLLGLSGFVVVIACSNLANFLLARTMERSREFAVRSALGASRRQLLQPLLLEALILASLGGLVAILVATGVTDWLRIRSTDDAGEQVVMAVNWSVMSWAFVCSLVTAVAFGLAPALFAMRLNLNETLKSGGRGTTGGRGHQLMRHLLIVGQFALAMVLLTGSALFINGLAELTDRRTGWNSEHLLTGTFLLPEAEYPSPEKIRAFQDLALERLRALPGIASVGLSSHPPFYAGSESRRVVVQGQERPPQGREPTALINVITPDYLNTVGTTVRAGRAFDQRDTSDAPLAVIINAAMAETLFEGTDPIGRRIARVNESDLAWAEVVGVVSNVSNTLPDPAITPFQVYVPMAQEPRTYNEMAVRTNGVDPNSLASAIRTTIADLDPDLPVRNLKSADDRVARALYQLGVLRDMLTGFACLGLALAAIGIYGVIARTMAQRRNEFGIRLALGAQVQDITRIVLAAGARLSLTGAALGLIGGIGLSQLLKMGFPNMQLENPWIIAGATALLVVIALVACYLPARHAAQISPTEALRAE